KLFAAMKGKELLTLPPAVATATCLSSLLSPPATPHPSQKERGLRAWLARTGNYIFPPAGISPLASRVSGYPRYHLRHRLSIARSHRQAHIPLCPFLFCRW